jgi:uncharacterized protein
MNVRSAKQKASQLKKRLLEKGYPVRSVYLFGSFAQGRATPDSDIDIAIICDPFRKTKLDESAEFLWESRNVDVKIETICLHPQDMENKYSTLVQEIKRHGIPIGDSSTKSKKR